MGDSNQPSLEDWTDFAGEWIKAEFIKEFPAKLVCISIEGVLDDGKSRLIAVVEYLDKTWKFDLNKTNQSVLRKNKLMPKDIIGKVLHVDKIKVRNPSSGEQVDSILISDVE